MLHQQALEPSCILPTALHRRIEAGPAPAKDGTATEFWEEAKCSTQQQGIDQLKLRIASLSQSLVIDRLTKLEQSLERRYFCW
jgi:hypothetical protein